MAALRYRKFLKLCEMWPVDELKVAGDRDLGKYLRKRIAIAFDKGEMSAIRDETVCDQEYNSLYNIATDHHRQKYPRSRNFTATGCSLADIRLVTSSDGLNSAQYEVPGFLERLVWWREKKKDHA